MKEYVWIGAAYKDLRQLKEKFRYWQRNTELIKQRIYDPYDTDLDKYQWEMSNQQEIWENRYILKNLEKEIRELRKIIRKMNKEQNEQNNI